MVEFRIGEWLRERGVLPPLWPANPGHGLGRFPSLQLPSLDALFKRLLYASLLDHYA
jgi:hypothetical protein